ncbi:hypothetical protein DL762_005285 [Monosporascus cannonballus]|uniref:DNA replication factor Cdt1 C-terminal domain-containing protein n=1 Tax=Monosporascus cannonballus TaxID=155416 RepID=A0ABY0H5D1_9PEZI|nr:hypothetical protein DL762_005285 [Monosporascus cannonballus]
MPTAVRRGRKTHGSGRPKVAAPQQHTSSSISSFTRVSKSVGDTDLKKEPTRTPQKCIKLDAITPGSRKRKAIATSGDGEDDEDDDSSADERPRKLALPARTTPKTAEAPTPVKRGRGRPPKKGRAEPAPLKRVRSPSVSDSEQSGVDAGALFKRLRIESSPSRCSTPPTADTSIAGSDEEADNDNNKATQPGQLPDDLLALIDLHSSFLKTLTLHYVHNGTNVPADLRILRPNVARAWGKKNVTEADIRICLGVLGASGVARNLFSLSDYGRGKICVEIDASHGSGPLNEKRLNDLFRANLTSLWSQQHRTKGGEPDATAFMKALPRVPITFCESVAKASPMLAKGQKRLEELKQGMALKKEAKTKPSGSSSIISQKNNDTSNSSATPTTTNADGTKMSLLDRIRYKSLQKAAGGSSTVSLTPAQLERRAALQRAADVALLLAMLGRSEASGGLGGRVSFTMAALLQRLRDSLRSPVSRDEGAACVRLLAAEVAPEWVRVVVLGGRENVVLEVDRQLSRAEVEGRVRGLVERG